MPELPEVETVVRGLKPLVGKRVQTAETFRKDLRSALPQDLHQRLTTQHLTAIERRAKYILMSFGRNDILIIHLGMSGKVLLTKTCPKTLQKHDHVRIVFDDGTTLTYNDARRFGRIELATKAEILSHILLKNIGIEPLSSSFDGDMLFTLLQSRKSPIKNALLDQTLVAGVGNIYASESLFLAKISPKRIASNVTRKEAALLAESIKTVLEAAIKSGGSTLRDYVRSSGDMGYFQHEFNVYGRENEPCFACKDSIKRLVQQGRATFYCPSCQKR